MKLLSQIINPVIKPEIGSFYFIPGVGISYVPGTSTATVYVIQKFLVNFIRLFFVAGSVIMLFMLIWGAIEYITAGGEKEKLGNASKRITNALIGITILLSIYALLWLVNLVFGINILKLDIPVI